MSARAARRVAWGVSLAMLITACGDDAAARRSAAHDYAADAPRCALAPSAPRAGDGTITTAAQLEVLVRVPRNYRQDIAHPLLVVYAAAGMRPGASEALTGFTPVATAAGYVVAYAQHLRPSRAALARLARVPAEVAAHWCIDPARVVMSGHSDGGTTATALAVLPASRDAVAAIAPSAAGFTAADLRELGCPAPRAVLVWHGAKDGLFPGWGRQAAHWWAGCDHCDTAQAPQAVDGCLRYAGCERPVQYCEGDYGHLTWPPRGAARTVAFFDAAMGKR